jgi:hypothetical protein
MEWFSYSANAGFELHDSEDSARATAERQLEDEREYARANDGWGDGVESVCWGRVSQVSSEAVMRPGGSEGMAYSEFSLSEPVAT